MAFIPNHFAICVLKIKDKAESTGFYNYKKTDNLAENYRSAKSGNTCQNEIIIL